MKQDCHGNNFLDSKNLSSVFSSTEFPDIDIISVPPVDKALGPGGISHKMLRATNYNNNIFDFFVFIV